MSNNLDGGDNEPVKRICVSVSKQYDVLLGNGLLNDICGLISPVIRSNKAAVITDDIVDGLYGHAVAEALSAGGFDVFKSVFTNGERSKTIGTLSNILEFLAQNGFRRNDLLIALGGGVAGDIGGLAAALYMRGIGYIQAPTTLLAMVDASIGGKTAIDLAQGKNLAGAFWQPSLVVCDTDIIRMLPQDIFNEGMAEVIKCGVIKESGIIEAIESGDVATKIDEIVESCITLKRSIVEQDELDCRGIRNMLNAGHTFAHAIEKLSGYTVSHGKAVATGLVWEATIAYCMGLCDMETVERVKNAVSSYDLLVPVTYDKAKIITAMSGDKKNKDGRIVFVLPKQIGECVEVKLFADELTNLLDMTRKVI